MKEETMLRHSTIMTFSALGGILLLACCAGTDTIPAQQPLYDRLGGKPAISAVIEEFVADVAGERRINGRVPATEIPRLKTHLVVRDRTASAGRSQTRGRSLKNSHHGESRIS